MGFIGCPLCLTLRMLSQLPCWLVSPLMPDFDQTVGPAITEVHYKAGNPYASKYLSHFLTELDPLVPSIFFSAKF